jgi:hypothetical protein
MNLDHSDVSLRRSYGYISRLYASSHGTVETLMRLTKDKLRLGSIQIQIRYDIKSFLQFSLI